MSEIRYFHTLPVTHGHIGLIHDWFSSTHVRIAGACWHRIENCDRGNPYEAPGRAIFWVHERIGADPYRAVVDDFGNLARIN